MSPLITPGIQLQTGDIVISKGPLQLTASLTTHGPLTDDNTIPGTEMTGIPAAEKNTILDSALQGVGHGFEDPFALGLTLGSSVVGKMLDVQPLEIQSCQLLKTPKDQSN